MAKPLIPRSSLGRSNDIINVPLSLPLLSNEPTNDIIYGSSVHEVTPATATAIAITPVAPVAPVAVVTPPVVSPFNVPRAASRSALVKKPATRPALQGINDSMVESGSAEEIAGAAAAAALPSLQPSVRFVPDQIPKGSFRARPASTSPNLAAPIFTPVPMPLSSHSSAIGGSGGGGGSYTHGSHASSVGVIHSQSSRTPIDFTRDHHTLVDIKEEKSTLSSLAGSQAGSSIGFKSISSSSMRSASFVLRDTAVKNVVAANTVYKLIERNGPHHNLQNVAYLRPGDFFYPDQDDDNEDDEHTQMAATAASLVGSAAVAAPSSAKPARVASKELGLVFEPHDGDMEQWLRTRRYRLERAIDMTNRRKYRESALKNYHRRSLVNLNEPLPDQPPFPPLPSLPYLTLAEAQNLAFQLLSGLVELHDLGLVHRGLSPQSILLFSVPNPANAPYHSPEHPLFYSLDGQPSNITFKIGDFLWARRKKHGNNASNVVPKGSDDEYKLYCASRQFTSLYLPANQNGAAATATAAIVSSATGGVAPPSMAGSAVFSGANNVAHDPTVPLEYHNDVYSLAMILYAAISLDDMSPRGTPIVSGHDAPDNDDTLRSQRTTVETSSDEKARGIRERGALGKSHRDMMNIGGTATIATATTNGSPATATATAAAVMATTGGISSASMNVGGGSFMQSPSFNQRPSRMARKRRLIISKLRDINSDVYRRYGTLCIIIADMMDNTLTADKGQESRVALDRVAQLEYSDDEVGRSCHDERILRVSFLDDQKLAADRDAGISKLASFGAGFAYLLLYFYLSLKGYVATSANSAMIFLLIGQLAVTISGVAISADVKGTGRWYGGEWTTERVILLITWFGVFFSHFFRLWDTHGAILEIICIILGMMECFAQFMFVWHLSNPFVRNTRVYGSVSLLWRVLPFMTMFNICWLLYDLQLHVLPTTVTYTSPVAAKLRDAVLLLAIIYRVRLIASFSSLVATAPTFAPDHRILVTPLPHPFISYVTATSLALDADPTRSQYVAPTRSDDHDNRCVAFLQCAAPFIGYLAAIAVVISPIMMLGFAFSDSNPAQSPSLRTDILTMISVAMCMVALYWAAIFHRSQSRRFFLFSMSSLVFAASMILAVTTGIIQAASVDSLIGSIASCILSLQCIIQAGVIIRINSNITLQFRYSVARFGLGFLWLYNLAWTIILLFSNWHPSIIEADTSTTISSSSTDWFTFLLRAGAVHYRLWSSSFFFECINLDASRRLQQYLGCRVVKGAARYQMLRDAAKKQQRRGHDGSSGRSSGGVVASYSSGAPDVRVNQASGVTRKKNPLSYGSADSPSISVVRVAGGGGGGGGKKSSNKKKKNDNASTPLLPPELADSVRGSAMVARDPSGAFITASSLEEAAVYTSSRPTAHAHAVASVRGSSLVARDSSFAATASSPAASTSSTT